MNHKSDKGLFRYVVCIAITVLIFSVGQVSAQSTFPSFGIIHNSLIPAEQTIMLGVDPAGNLNTANNAGSAATNSLNQTKDSRGGTITGANAGSVGISYYWPGAQKKDSKGVLVPNTYYPQGWYDSTSQGSKWESWAAGAYDNRNQQALSLIHI